jgi:hypothetical protein
MKIAYIIALSLIPATFCLAQIPVTKEQMKPIPGTAGSVPKPKWADTAVNYKIIFRGELGVGKDDFRKKKPLQLFINVVMQSGLVVPLKYSNDGVIRNSNDPERRVFYKNLSGESLYCTNLNISLVEIIQTDNYWVSDANTLSQLIYDENLAPDEWNFVSIKLNARVVYMNPVNGSEQTIASREVLNINVNRKMKMGIWASAPSPAYYNPPQQITDATGKVAARVLTGKDDMKKNHEKAAVLIQTSDKIIRYSLGVHIGLPAYSFPNYDAFAKFEGSYKWSGIGKVGLEYKYGDHGPFDRDDWEVKALFVDFFPDFLRSKNICFRKSAYYIHNNNEAYLIKMNGDNNGMLRWAPFY